MTVSGLPEAETEQALTVLLKEYRSHLSATESGELVYEFDPEARAARRGQLPRALAASAPRSGPASRFLFKISIVVTLVVYFVLFVAMLIALVFARRSDDGDDAAAAVSASAVCSGSGAGSRASGGVPRRVGATRPRAAKPFYKSVFDFVFGPPAPKVDPLGDEKEILAAIRPAQGAHRRRRSGRADGLGLRLAPRRRRRGSSPITAASPRSPTTAWSSTSSRTLRKRPPMKRGSRGAVRPRMAWERPERAPALTGNASRPMR